MKKRNQLRNQEGFTLLEVIVVAVIVAILAGVSIPLYGGYVDNSRANQAANVAGSVASFLGACYQTPGAVPMMGEAAFADPSETVAQVADEDPTATLTCEISDDVDANNPQIQIPRGFVVRRAGNTIFGRWHEVEAAGEGESSPYAFSAPAP